MKEASMRFRSKRLFQKSVLQEGLSSFWSSAGGWAPIEAAELLSKSRLDWQVSLSHCLRSWLEPGKGDRQIGELILAWVNLGSLVEGTLMLFLSVHYTDYKASLSAMKTRMAEPDTLMLDRLRQFVKDNVWTDTDGRKWVQWISQVQQRRNAIHAFRNRPLGSHAEFLEAVRNYLAFLRFVDYHFPYP
jgi:hypothetical protein